jgi:hypothetical protein
VRFANNNKFGLSLSSLVVDLRHAIIHAFLFTESMASWFDCKNKVQDTSVRRARLVLNTKNDSIFGRFTIQCVYVFKLTTNKQKSFY